MNLEEIQFLTESHEINILPRFSLPKLYLISGEVGPFEPNKLLKVPLWLAVNLKQLKKCTIVPPNWMDVELLEEIRENEKAQTNFTVMPSQYYMTEAKIILSSAVQDIPRAEEIRSVIRDIWDIRMAKLRAYLKNWLSSENIQLNGLTLEEINTIHSILPESLDHLNRLNKVYVSQSLSQSDSSFSNNTF